MATRATGTFDLDTWDEQPWHELDGTRLSRTRVTKTFHGEFEGHSVSELVMAAAGETSRAYAGFERFEGRVNGRSGSFVLHHNAAMTGSGQSASWNVLPESGSGELRGISGAAQITIEPGGGHTFTLDYELG